MPEDAQDVGGDAQAEERLHEVWMETRDDVSYEYLVDLNWDLCKEIAERDEHAE